MAEKEATPAKTRKKCVPKSKAMSTNKPVTKKAAVKGTSYACDVCGLVVVVDEECGCAEVCDIICCSTPMKERKTKIKTAAKA